MNTTTRIFTKHCAFPSQYQSILHYSSFNFQDQEKPAIFQRIDASLEKQRKKLETEMIGAQYTKRLTPEMKKKYTDFLNMDKTLETRHQLMQQAFEQGYFDDAKEIMKKGPKLWEASEIIFPSLGSHFIPNVTAYSLSTNEKRSLLQETLKYKVSLVSFVFSAYGDPHVKSFVDAFRKEFNDERVGLINMQVEENKFKQPIVWMMRPFFRMSVPKDKRDCIFTLSEDISKQRKMVGMTNSVLGWVNLVDSTGKIRWQAHGIATEKELATLIALTKSLL